MVFGRGLALPQPESSAPLSPGTARSVWPASCSGAKSRPRASISSLYRAGKCLMRRSPVLKPTTPKRSPAASARGRNPAGRLAAAVVLALVAAYKAILSPVFTGCCRFQPSCSDYLAQAVSTHGALRGTWLGLRRLARCHPFGGSGLDPCPPRSALATPHVRSSR